MTSPSPMTREELRALAALDAFGLLDEYETALYTRSFHHAPAAVQSEITELQAELVSDESLLPDVTPPAELRIKVLQVVARAIETKDTELAPIATIGRSVRPSQPSLAVVQTSGRLRALLFGNNQYYWRAAAFVLIGALAVMSYFWSEVYRQNSRITTLVLDADTDKLLAELGDEFGPTFETFLRDPSAERISLLPPQGGDEKDWATLWVRTKDEQAILIVRGLPIGNDQYTLSTVDSSGRAREVMRFRQSRERATHRVTLTAFSREPNSTWQITSSAGVVLLRSS